MISRLKSLLKAVLPEPAIRALIHIHAMLFGQHSQAEKDKAERARRVSSATTLEAVRAVAREMGYTYFLDYDAQIETKRREFRSALEHFGVSVAGKSVLDVGPGTADSLDCAQEMGAAETLFVEGEPFFVKFAEIKGHRGWATDYTAEPFFPAALRHAVDVIYTKGSINCVWVNEQHASSGRFDFPKWVDALKTLLKPGGEMILMPAMGRQEERIIDPEYDLDTYYWCADVDAYRQSHFVQTLVDKGFEVVEKVPGFTQPKAFPLAFHYKNAD